MSYAAFTREVERINDLLCTANLLSWDARVMMPPGGVTARGQQFATVTDCARELATGDAMRRAIEGAERELDGVSPNDPRVRAVRAASAGIGVLSRIPPALLSEAATLKTEGQAVWARARAANDFDAFAPTLERTVEIQRQVAEAIGYDDHPYDALVGTYEPGMTWRRLQGLYAEIKSGLLPLIERALAKPQPRTDFLERAYPVESQKRFARMIAERMGYDFSRGRLDDTVHPFEISFTRGDVRITSRFQERWLPGGLFAVWHEVGHGMYEQGIDPAFTRSAFTTDFVNLYAVGGASFGMHESQSRLWENRVGRSRRFWELHFDELRAVFPDQLADVSAEEFWRAVNRVKPSLIRVEADEMTYDLHIILRSEIEAALIAGEVSVKDVRALWAEKVKATLGLDVPTDTLGVLQDVHWSSGMIGSFPTYTLGNVMAAQLFEAALEAPGVAEGLDRGAYDPLKTWLNENVHRHGRSSLPEDTLVRVTGDGLRTDAYLRHLEEKVGAMPDA
ncbi:carboxypeptidase M32 [Aurantimonas sp. VKM B-3413]|uniref:carboxypeptidase M32 n=1 Tax=Aurantimonas sp. VKM B-3413 TaxID=2779401 RepID=UPI001E63760F|nr:carboxypeptidase M32 [Aurantimonas sp. VKM B-3413]MCB8836407.1 carboxypeptidase M32 [Aurantimonas sp. VKM B-3413]